MPNSKFLILLKGSQGSKYCSPGALLKLRAKLFQKLYTTAGLGCVLWNVLSWLVQVEQKNQAVQK